ncbi:MAG: hypothetical protein M0R46_17060 [Candidatus Muirbacterium halophilum]|nr:hypothetical protein [Candidatus Muirbacterium halophilum]MCK9477628.1 hypothetical protein [Candidatus Muirbacterium halophilum]
MEGKFDFSKVVITGGFILYSLYSFNIQNRNNSILPNDLKEYDHLNDHREAFNLEGSFHITQNVETNYIEDNEAINIIHQFSQSLVKNIKKLDVEFAKILNDDFDELWK